MMINFLISIVIVSITILLAVDANSQDKPDVRIGQPIIIDSTSRINIINSDNRNIIDMAIMLSRSSGGLPLEDGSQRSGHVIVRPNGTHCLTLVTEILCN